MLFIVENLGWILLVYFAIATGLLIWLLVLLILETRDYKKEKK